MYKVVERFMSIQGEGYWAGTPMAFVRLAQCPVGGADGICKAWNGREFLCDTGKKYHLKKRDEFPFDDEHMVEHHPYTEVNETLTAADIRKWVTETGLKHLCVTGGEPLIYEMGPLLDGSYLTHVETSGTMDIPMFPRPVRHRLWFTVSPKWNASFTWMKMADEVKVLVDKDTSVRKIEDNLPLMEIGRLYFQPIEDEHWKENTENAIALATHFGAKVSVQIHKYIGLR